MVELGFSNRKEPWFCCISRIWKGGGGLVNEHLKKAVELENTRGFTRKFRGENKIHLMEICFNNRGAFHENHRDCHKKESFTSCHPEGDKGSGWEVLRRAIISVQDYSDQVGEERKKMFGINQLSKSRYRGGRSYAEVVAEDGIRSGVPVAAEKWARAVICECKEKVQDWTDEGKAIARLLGVKGMVSINPISAFKGCFFVSTAGRAKWLQEQERLLVKGRLVLLRRWSPRENMFTPGKFRREVGRVTEVARETVKLLDLTKVKLWVEMHPRVVLPALLEVEDGAWKHTVAVSVIGEEGEDGNVTSRHPTGRYEWLKEGGCVSQTPKFAEGLRGSIRGNECYRRELLPRARYRRSSTSMAAKRENGWEGSRLGFVEEVILGAHRA
ncbi:hypothetical protein CK203_097204 [Vitis vinifera]|uniref:DUF4283 domain-containing protein n=1 Tax=Vitis vinifera TaxID=29760 RepID=A0A438DJ11_VITVI|nr:hypothetical protein CK203_097204 [Vitis vinifera]